MKSLVLYLVTVASLSGYAQKITRTYLDTGDSSANYYLTMVPASQPKAVLILLPGFGERPDYVVKETDIPAEAARRGILTIIPMLKQGWQSLYVDGASQQVLDTLLLAVQKRYPLTSKRLYVGGFSLGGSGAVRYAERAMTSSALPRPAAVFAIDPPLDFTRFYQSLVHESSQRKPSVAVNEASYFIMRMQREFGGSPDERPDQYKMVSPYTYADTNMTAIQSLKSVPIRLICEPDIYWQMRERGRTFYELNATDCTAMISSLRRAGNTQAEYVQTVNKGYRRQQRTRNPHSWSIAEPKATIDWLLHY